MLTGLPCLLVQQVRLFGYIALANDLVSKCAGYALELLHRECAAFCIAKDYCYLAIPTLIAAAA
jgi:hypothetical protein